MMCYSIYLISEDKYTNTPGSISVLQTLHIEQETLISPPLLFPPLAASFWKMSHGSSHKWKQGIKLNVTVVVRQV